MLSEQKYFVLLFNDSVGAMLRPYHFQMVFFSYLLESGCLGEINKTDDMSRGGKDFQDTGLGICHSHGMRPISKTLRNIFHLFHVQYFRILHIVRFYSIIVNLKRKIF